MLPYTGAAPNPFGWKGLQMAKSSWFVEVFPSLECSALLLF